MWNVPRLFRYSLDHFRGQVETQKIHPAVALAIGRENGIPSLIGPAIQALAEPAVSLHSWCCNPRILRYVQVEEIGAIVRMKERLYEARLSMVDVPPVTHRGCADQAGCGSRWERYWHATVGKKVRNLFGGTLVHQLWFIRVTDVLKAEVPGMNPACLSTTIERVEQNPCWLSDKRIIDGAIEHLMVAERLPDWHRVNNNGGS